MWNLIFAMLHNTATDRWHPILFYESPLPGPPHEGKPIRHKSKGHHTEGFNTRDEAVIYCETRAKELNASLCIEKAFAWDGEETPAMVVFFATCGDELIPANLLSG